MGEIPFSTVSKVVLASGVGGMGIGLALGNRTTRKYAGSALLRSAVGLFRLGNMIRFGAPLAYGGRATTAFTTSAKGGIGGSSLLAGYVAGSIVGTAISYAIWGKSGAQSAIDFYTWEVGIVEPGKTVGWAIGKTAADVSTKQGVVYGEGIIGGFAMTYKTKVDFTGIPDLKMWEI